MKLVFNCILITNCAVTHLLLRSIVNGTGYLLQVIFNVVVRTMVYFHSDRMTLFVHPKIYNYTLLLIHNVDLNIRQKNCLRSNYFIKQK